MGKTINEAEDLEHVRQWLFANGLCLNMVKTEYLLTGSKYNNRTLAEEPCLFIGHKPVKRVLVTKTLAVNTDQFLLTRGTYNNIIIKMISAEFVQ